MKFSRQRELIRKTVKANLIHPTADQIYGMLHGENPSISLATVYRNLNLLAQVGEITKITVPNAGDRFDANTSEHYHMICNQCGRMFDCPIEPFTIIDCDINRQTGFTVESHQFIVYGVCQECTKA